MRQNILSIALMIALLAGCSKDDPSPKAPGPVTLVFPEDNSLCVTGISQGPTTSLVRFSWEAAEDADSYEFQLIPLGSGGVQRQVTTRLSLDVVLDKGAPYSWQVTALNQESREETSSEVWQFFNAGSTLTYPPFPARLLEPGSGASVFPDGNGQLFLVWEPSDPDNDLAEIEVYFGTDPDGLSLEETLCCTEDRLQVSVTSGTVYYWQVLSRDAEGNTSLSAINSFRAL